MRSQDQSHSVAGSPAVLLAGEFVSGGREAHLAALQEAIECSARGSFGLRIVSASAGAGKTTLLAAACQIALELHPETVILWANCLYSPGMTNGPLRDICQQTIDIDTWAQLPPLLNAINRQRIEQRRSQALAALVEHGAELIDRWIPKGDVVRCAGHAALDDATQQLLDGLVLPSPEGRRDGYSPVEAFARMLRAWSTGAPTIVVLDDFHRAGGATCESLLYLLHEFRGSGTPLLILAACRPEAVENLSTGVIPPVQGFIAEARRCDPGCLVDLDSAIGGPAGRVFVEQLLAQQKGMMPGEFSETLFRRTDGLPLFVTGILHSLEQDGHLPGRDGAGENRPLEWPGEIASVFADWLSRLSPEQLQALQLASVQGEIFNASAVNWLMRHTSQSPGDQVIEQLHRQHLIVPVGTTLLDGRMAHYFRFHHDLVREYVHGALTPKMQVDFHRQTAQALHTLYGDECGPVARLVAWHYEASGERASAARAWLNAARFDLLTLDYPAAIEKFRHARDGARDVAECETEASALIGLAHCARFGGTRQEARVLAESALARIAGHRLPLVEAEILYLLGTLDYDAGYPEQAAIRLEQAVRGLEMGGKRAESGRASTMLSHARYQYGEIGLALRAAREARRIAIGEQDDWDLVDALVAEANCHGETGNYAVALDLLMQGADLCESLVHPRAHLLCLFNGGLYAGEMGDLDRASMLLNRAIELADRRQAIRSVGYASSYLGYVEEARGNWEAARFQYARACDIRTAEQQPGLLLDSLAGVLRVAIAEQDQAEIRMVLGKLQQLALSRHGPGEMDFDPVHGRLVVAEHPIRIYLALIHGAAIIGDHAASQHFLESAMTLLRERAAKLHDPDMRDSFVTAIPAHRMLMRLAIERNLPGLTL